MAGITLEWESLAAIIQQEDVYTTPMYFAFPDQRNQGNVTIRNLKFKGNTSAATVATPSDTGGGGTGALLGIVGGPTYSARTIRVENCLFEDGHKTNAVYLGNLEDVLAKGCSFLHFKDYFVATAMAAATTPATGNITLSGTQSIDGVSLVAGDRVLLQNQSTRSQNGIYVVSSGTWSRAGDANTAALPARDSRGEREGERAASLFACTTCRRNQTHLVKAIPSLIRRRAPRSEPVSA